MSPEITQDTGEAGAAPAAGQHGLATTVGMFSPTGQTEEWRDFYLYPRHVPPDINNNYRTEIWYF